jgi:Cyclophilin-like family
VTRARGMKSTAFTVGLFLLPILAACGSERTNEASSRDDGPEASVTQPPAAATQPASRPPATATTDDGRRTQELRLTVNETVLKVTLLDSETARDFVSLLPLTLTLADYAQCRKVVLHTARCMDRGSLR